MPISARKSSLGASRRGPQKYIRYRADDLQHGKRTGIAVGFVDRDSDEFEPFEKVIGQADLRTPPKPNVLGRKKKVQKTPLVEEYDEDGEMSMELEESIPNSPAAYFANGIHTITSSVQRVGSSSRSVQRRSDVDFDRIPSPRRDSFAPSSGRQSMGRSKNSRTSSLSRSITARDVQGGESESEPELEPINYSPPPEDYEEHPPESPEGDSDPERTPVPSSRRSTSRARPTIVQVSHEEEVREEPQADEDEEEDEVERHMTAKSSKAKGKARQAEEELDEAMEEDIAQGLEEVDNIPEEEMDQEDEGEEPEHGTTRRRGVDDSVDSQPRPTKKARFDENAGQKKSRGRPRKDQQVLREVVQDQNVDDNGLRRGHRMRYKPLEWWRCEKVVYGRRESGVSLVPTIKEIRRLPKEDIKPLGKHARKRTTRGKSQSATVEPEDGPDYNPEEGWDDETEPTGVVLQYPTNQEVEQRIAFTGKMFQPKPAANADFSFQKIFGDGGFMAAGQLVIPPGGSKPTKGTKDNTFIFYVIQGAVTFKVHRTSFIVATNGMFMVPRGNMYYIQNISDRDAKLFFAQARKSDADDGSRSPSKSRTPVQAHGPSPEEDEEEEEEEEDIKVAKVPTKRTKRRN